MTTPPLHNTDDQRIARGYSKLPEYNNWQSMKNRCLNPKERGYSNYGGRGITICNRWINSFQSFYEDMGLKPSPRHTLDRIDVNGNYEPGNVRWATVREQNLNKRTPPNKETGLHNIRWRSDQRRYEVMINHTYVGGFKDLDDAIEAKGEYEKELALKGETRKALVNELGSEEAADKAVNIMFPYKSFKNPDLYLRRAKLLNALLEYGEFKSSTQLVELAGYKSRPSLYNAACTLLVMGLVAPTPKGIEYIKSQGLTPCELLKPKGSEE